MATYFITNKFYPFCTKLEAYTIYLVIRILLRSLLLSCNKKIMVELALHAMKPCGEVGVQLHSLLNSGLGGQP
jgi:hypothetical protein